MIFMVEQMQIYIFVFFLGLTCIKIKQKYTTNKLYDGNVLIINYVKLFSTPPMPKSRKDSKGKLETDPE